MAAAIVALLVRRMDADRVLRILLPGVLLVAAVLLNTGSPLYFIHVTPGADRFRWRRCSPTACEDSRRSRSPRLDPGRSSRSLSSSSALAAVNSARSVWGVAPPAAESPSTRAFVERVRSTVERDCRVAGDGGQYVRHFTDYPNFVSWRATEVKYAMLFFGMTDEAAYWEVKRPDAVVSQQVFRLDCPLRREDGLVSRTRNIDRRLHGGADGTDPSQASGSRRSGCWAVELLPGQRSSRSAGFS